MKKKKKKTSFGIPSFTKQRGGHEQPNKKTNTDKQINNLSNKHYITKQRWGEKGK